MHSAGIFTHAPAAKPVRDFSRISLRKIYSCTPPLKSRASYSPLSSVNMGVSAAI